MADFSYRAINDDNKEIHGHVDAVNIDAAKKALDDQHLEVIELHESSRSETNQPVDLTPQPTLQTTFAFEGSDTAGTIRRGTIQSESKYQAFERLKNDQKLFIKIGRAHV